MIRCNRGYPWKLDSIYRREYIGRGTRAPSSGRFVFELWEGLLGRYICFLLWKLISIWQVHVGNLFFPLGNPVGWIYVYIYIIYICICGRRKGEKSRVFWPRVLSLLSGLRWATFYTTSYSRLIVTRWMQYDIKRGRNSITGYTRSATKELGFSFPLPLSLFSFLFNFLENSRLAPMLLSPSFLPFYWNLRPCCMFKKESLEFDIEELPDIV